MTNRNSHPPFAAGNWKMHLASGEAARLASEIVKGAADAAGAELVLIPPFTSLDSVRRVVADSSVALGAQNMHWEDKGAFTGEVSPLMVKDAGCRYVVIGHSERRHLFGETDGGVNKKIKAALRTDLTPIFCLGETLEERQSGRTIDRIESQLIAGLEGLDGESVSKIVMAYEPVWAIGTGRTATPAQAQEVHGQLRGALSERYGKQDADCVIILYGGSVKPDNAFSLFREKDIDGFLVGGASLEASSFLRIAKEALRAHKEKP
ncbi:MAG: triose-phosphate isomerase [Candidatus Aminicenantes bacterium]|nr:triose-phosphate isomerase [Candidatus Aminicenantes bacterium]